jgi:chemotaxis protein MotB
MRTPSKKGVILLTCLISTALLPGCTSWKKKYNSLNVAYQNLQGRYENLQREKGQLSQRISQDQQTIEELQRQIEERKRTPGEVTGFGEGYEVALDPGAGTITVTLPNTILFSPGKETLMKETNTDLDHIQSVLQSRYAGKEVDVVGHTDSDPIKKSPWKDNWELSAQRALTVARYLMKRGVPEDKIRAVGCGAARPVDSNATASGKGRNRRVEIVVYMR